MKCLFKRLRLDDVAVFENRQLETAAKFINKSSLFILLLGVIRRLELLSTNHVVRSLFVSTRTNLLRFYILILNVVLSNIINQRNQTCGICFCIDQRKFNSVFNVIE